MVGRAVAGRCGTRAIAKRPDPKEGSRERKTGLGVDFGNLRVHQQ